MFFGVSCSWNEVVTFSRFQLEKSEGKSAKEDKSFKENRKKVFAKFHTQSQ